MTSLLLGGRYRLDPEPISNGSFGAVHGADDERMPRRVAVKVLHPRHATNPTVRERFRRELEAACRVSHENVVSVFDVGEDERVGLYYVMELVQGTPLRDRFGETPPLWPDVYRIALQLANALCAIHAAQIVHRDLKPQNIMLVERPGLEPIVKVLDFGIASIRENNEDLVDNALTGARNVLGTPPYMAPEQTYMRADRERLLLDIDARSDLYALGVVLYELVAGRRPFNGDAQTVVLAHRNVQPVPLERMAGVHAPRSFCRLVMQCLEKRPEERPQTARALRDAFALTEKDRPLAAPEAAPDAALAREALIEAPTEMFDVAAHRLPRPKPPAKAGRAGVWFGVIGVAAALGVGGLALLQPAPPAPVTPPPQPAPPAQPARLAEAPPPPRPAPPAPAPRPGFVNVVVTSEPAGATVADGAEVLGEAPVTRPVSLEGAASRKVSLTVTRQGFKPQTVEVEVTAAKEGQVELVHVRLERLGGPVAVRPGGPVTGAASTPAPAAPPPAAPKDPFEDL